MSKQHVVGIRLNSDIKEALQAVAEQQNRTLSNLVATICRDYYARTAAAFPSPKKGATSPT